MNDTTSQKYMPIGVRVLAVLTAGAFLFTSLGAAPAEASFWEERAAARNRHIQGSSAPVLLAQLPASQPLSFGGSIQPTLPSFSPKLSSLMGTAPRWAQGAVTPFADIRSVREGTSGALRVFLVMDAHDVYSAQRNVARLLAHLGNQGKMVVGVEGTSGAFDLERHRGLLPGVGQAHLVDHLLKKGFLNGSEAYGLTAEHTPLLWGVEDEKLYDANVRAYRETLGLEGETHTALETLKKETLARQSKIFSVDLLELDREVQAQHEGRGDMGKYVKAVLAGTGEGNHQSQVRRFMEAKSKEDSLSFPAVEQARAAFIERVSPRLSPFELDGLIRETTAFRSGSKSGKDYYRDLVSLALSKGVPVAAYPAFQSYIEYVSLTDGIDVVALMDELEVLEGRAFARLAQGESLVLAEWSNDLRLADRAVQHALTPREWTRFEERRGELSRLADRAVALGISRASAETLQTNLPRFAAFFEAAAARNNTLLENALAEAQRRGATSVALVTGGFHAPALEKRLAEKNMSHMVLTPRIEEIPDSAAGYLGAFAPTRTPLEKLLLGDRLFMNPPSATAVAVGIPGAPFHESQVALTRAEAGYGVALAGLRGKLAEFMSRWTERFGQATARVLQSGPVQVVEVQFAGSNETSMLVATCNGEPTSEDILSPAMRGQGGTVVETGTIADTPYVLGGKNLSRFIPELMGGVAFLAWLGGSALAPPALVVAIGFVGGVILGGMGFRAILLATTYWHGLGHSLLASALGGQPVRKSMAEYSQKLPLAHLDFGSSYFLPWFKPSKDAPHFAVQNLPQGWRTRVTALAGPVMNIVAGVVLGMIAWAADPLSALQLGLSTAAALNLWAAITSAHDMKSAISGIATFFACGVAGEVTESPNPHSEALPEDRVETGTDALSKTFYRGMQSLGIGVVAVKENGRRDYHFRIEKKAKEVFRRQQSVDMLSQAHERLIQRAKKGDYRGTSRTVIFRHSRLGTNNAKQKAKNAHPFVSHTRERNILYVGDEKINDNFEDFWLPPKGTPKLKYARQRRGVAIVANGDDNFSFGFSHRGEKRLVSNAEDNEDVQLTERLTGKKNEAKGDSPQIATRLDRWTTAGSVEDSLLLALSQEAFQSFSNTHPDVKVEKIPFEEILERQPDPALVASLMSAGAMKDFHERLAALSAKFPKAKTLRDLYAAAGAHVGGEWKVWDLEESIDLASGSEIERLRDELAFQADSPLSTTVPWFSALSESERKIYSMRFADLFLKFIFTGDIHTAAIHLLRRADSTSTYGTMAVSLSDPENAHWACLRQPFYLWLTEDGKSVAGSSASKAYRGGKAGGKDYRYRLTMKDGEVASIIGRKLVIHHMHEEKVTEYDLDKMGLVLTDKRWLDLESSPYVGNPTSSSVAPEDRVFDDFTTIPVLDEKIRKDFEPKEKNSKNRLTGLAFVQLLLSKREPGSIDLVIAGLEKSYDAGSLWRDVLEKLSILAGRPLRIELINTAKFTRADLVKLRARGFTSETMVLGVSSSGQTANTMYVLKNLHTAWRLLKKKGGSETAPHFLVSADMDNPHTEYVIGQGFHREDPFKERNFETFPGMDPVHPAEAATLTHKATERLLKEVTVLYAEGLAEEAKQGLNQLPVDVPAFVREMVVAGDELNRRIVGVNEEGNAHVNLRQSDEKEQVNRIPEQLREVAEGLAQRFLENLWATGATFLFVSLTLLFHATPASLLLAGWFPNALFLFSNGLPVLAFVVGVDALALVYWKTPIRTWHPFFQFIGALSVLSLGLFAGEVVVLGLDALSRLGGWGMWGSRWGALPIIVDVSPINLLNIFSYSFFPILFILALRLKQNRPLWDRFGGRILVISDFQDSVGRFGAGFWQRLLNQRFGWMGLNSVNFSGQGDLTHRETNNSNNRGNVFGHGESRTATDGPAKNSGIIGGTPNGPGTAWSIAIGHRLREKAKGTYSRYISLHMEGDNPAGDDPDRQELQELVLDAPARGTAWMRLGVEVSKLMAFLRPLNFTPGMTPNEAQVSTTQQPFGPLSDEIVAEVFGFTLDTQKAGSSEALNGGGAENSPAPTPLGHPQVKDVEGPGNSLPTPLKGQPIRPALVSRATLLALASSLGMSHFKPEDSANTLKKGIWEYLNDPANQSVRISGQHEAALLGVLASHVDDPSTAVTIHLGGQSLPLRDYLAGWTAGQAPEIFDVSQNGGVHVTVGSSPHTLSLAAHDRALVTGDASGADAGEGAKTPTEPATEKSHPTQSHGSDLAGLSALAEFLGVKTGAGDTDLYLKNQIRAALILGRNTDIPLAYVTPLVETLKGTQEAYRSVVWMTRQGSGEHHRLFGGYGIIPHWPSFRVTYFERVFDLSPTPVEATVPSFPSPQTNPVTDDDDLASPDVTFEPTSAGGENHLHDAPVPWGGVSNPHGALLSLAGFLNLAVGNDEADVQVAEKIEGTLKANPGQSVQIPGEYEDGLIAVLAQARDRQENPVQSYFNQGKPTGFPETLNTFIKRSHSPWTPWENYYVSFNEIAPGLNSFSVFPNPTHTFEEKPSKTEEDRSIETPTVSSDLSGQGEKKSPAALAEDVRWQRFYHVLVLEPLRKIGRVTIMVFGLLLLTSWGGTIVTSMERAVSKMFEQTEASQIMKALPSGESLLLNKASPVSRSVNEGLLAVPAAYVSASKKNLPAYDQFPYENVHTVARLKAKSHVNVLWREGSWARVETVGGNTGWVNGRHLSRNTVGEERQHVVVSRKAALYDQKPFAHSIRQGSLPAGTAFQVLERRGGWTKVAPADKPPVWVYGRIVPATVATPVTGSAAKSPVTESETPLPSPTKSTAADAMGLILMMGQTVPLLGNLGRRQGPVSNSAGAVLRRRLVAGEKRSWQGENISTAKSLLSFVENPHPLGMEQSDQQLVLAMGYGSLLPRDAWGSDRALYDDYRQARVVLNGEPLPVSAGKALSTLGREASRWMRTQTPAFAEGALPVINLTQAESETHLLHHWAAALDRASHGGPAPVLIVHDQAQQARLVSKLAEWRGALNKEHADSSLSDFSISSHHWVFLDTLGPDVVQRDLDGTPLAVRLGALLGTAKVAVNDLTSVDIVTGVQTPWEWDRSDMPSEISVRMIIGILKDLSLTAPFDDAQRALKTAREALTAA